MEKFRNGRHTDSCLTWSHTIFGRAFKFIKQRRFQVDYACAFLHIFVFNNVVAWPLLLCFSIFPPTKILDTPRRALTGHRQQVHVLQLLNIAAAIFSSQNWPWLVDFLFIFFCFVWDDNNNVTCSKSCVGGFCVSSSAEWTDRNREKGWVLKQRHTQ